ncbi:LVIS_2131 family protein [Fructilactobacillus fructivorans]|uniref:LVIS_2131 family protein n=1 Tax=Fructilactobacillus fructivorans TaxID=1614 RepID=UPI0007054D46|nr:LVIS_2131 family protein [Fructilactobacillus fructivorans]KRN42774.1 hypothetical protein IV48_GL001180 [Fructilactobacillus fructivorans]
MNSWWNLVGVIAWLIVLVVLILVIKNIRSRRIKMIVQDKKTFEWRNLLISIGEIVAFLVLLALMVYTTFFRNITKTNNRNVVTTTQVEPLIIQSDEHGSYYVKVEGNKGPIQQYSFWLKNVKYQLPSTNAQVVTTRGNAEVTGRSYKLNRKNIKLNDQHFQNAWAKVVTLTYKGNFWNGLGMHAGKDANQFILIRVPNKTFVQRNK